MHPPPALALQTLALQLGPLRRPEDVTTMAAAVRAAFGATIALPVPAYHAMVAAAPETLVTLYARDQFAGYLDLWPVTPTALTASHTGQISEPALFRDGLALATRHDPATPLYWAGLLVMEAPGPEATRQAGALLCGFWRLMHDHWCATGARVVTANATTPAGRATLARQGFVRTHGAADGSDWWAQTITGPRAAQQLAHFPATLQAVPWHAPHLDGSARARR